MRKIAATCGGNSCWTLFVNLINCLQCSTILYFIYFIYLLISIILFAGDTYGERPHAILNFCDEKLTMSKSVRFYWVIVFASALKTKFGLCVSLYITYFCIFIFKSVRGNCRRILKKHYYHVGKKVANVGFVWLPNKCKQFY